MTAAITRKRGLRLDMRGSDESEVRSQVWSVLATLYQLDRLDDRRRHDRFPFPQLVQLLPVADDGTPVGEAFLVAGKHLSERGLGFHHPGPIPHRRVIASMQRADETWISFLLELKWCRFIRQGWYESGGKFLRAAVLPCGPPAQEAALMEITRRDPLAS